MRTANRDIQLWFGFIRAIILSLHNSPVYQFYIQPTLNMSWKNLVKFNDKQHRRFDQGLNIDYIMG